MSFPNPFDTAYWIEYQHEPPKSNVVQLPVAKRANAAQAAESLEQDRKNMRIDIWNDLSREKRQLLERLGQIEAAMAELA